MKLTDFDINYIGVDAVINTLNNEYALYFNVALTVWHIQEEKTLYGITTTISYYLYHVYIEPGTNGKMSKTLPVTFPVKISEQDTITDGFLVTTPDDDDIEPYFTGNILATFGIDTFFNRLVE